MKKIIAILLVATLLFIPMTPKAIACGDVSIQDVSHFISRIIEIYSAGYAKGQVTLSDAKECAILCGMSTASPEAGSIGIGKILNEENAYIITLGGTELNSKENNGFSEDVLSAFNQSNEYLKSCLSAIKAAIPSGSTIYIYGYSLGGMVLQQVLADRNIKNNYNIGGAVAFGSPIVTINRSPIIFFEDTEDIVPKMSPLSLFAQRIFSKYDTHIIRDTGSKTFISAHALSYVDSSAWNNIDVLGQQFGTHFFIIDMDDFHTFLC